LGGRRTAAVLQEVLVNPRETVQARVAAAGSLAQMGKPPRYAYDLCLTSAHMPVEVITKAARGRSGGYRPSEMEEISLRRLAAISLGWMGRPDAVNVLYPLLKNYDGGVRVAAAMSIVRLQAAKDATAAPVRKRSLRVKQALHRH
ncbi:MAG: HEAT repeat domain-containing protein, partial [Planctomycetes bacterium]|nr:HEAT repeat domain-containing protein [Planctomycetota bacterium]